MDLGQRTGGAFAPAAAAVAAGHIPGAVLGVVDRTGQRAVRHAGWASLVPDREPLGPGTWFDLASLTKVVFTTTAILRLWQGGRLELDTPLAELIPDLRQYDVAQAPERRLTVRECLAHRTHLPAVEPIYTYGRDPQTLRAFVLQRAWRPVAEPVYSDINFILLGIVIERLTGSPLASQPLADGLCFAPEPATCAATEHCMWRGRVLRGEVHDENAFALGGAAGHAGLFGTIDGVLDFAHGVLAGIGWPPAMMAAIAEPAGARRTLGWECRHEGWSGGGLCSPGTIGHVGFTGTGLWIDREAGLAWSLLTNRVHPTRHRDTGIVQLRRRTGEALFATGA
ncbi:serine hydrolase domain-containing protein [Lichenicoccus sp.]|uniref:serine hydrolase domain-containing protein n=1 Tax=Lichenicoccus sp. TaxID=2781899 RepID=UPI003D0F7D2A